MLSLKFSQGEPGSVCAGELMSLIEFAELLWAEKKKNRSNKEVRCDLWFWLQLQQVCADTADLLVQDTVVEGGGSVCTVYCLFDTTETKRAEVEINLRGPV